MKYTFTEANINDALVLAEISEKTFRSTYANLMSEVDLNKYISESFSQTRTEAEVTDVNNRFVLASISKLHDSDPPY